MFRDSSDGDSAMERADKLCVHAGYFQNDVELLTDALAKIEQLGAPGIYVSLNRASNDWLAKSNHRLKSRTKTTIGDLDVLKRDWLIIDCDPTRLDDSGRPIPAAKIAATDAEVERAKEVAKVIRTFLESEGWPKPLVCFSGNGFYLLYRIDLPNDEASKLVVEKCPRSVFRLGESLPPFNLVLGSYPAARHSVYTASATVISSTCKNNHARARASPCFASPIALSTISKAAVGVKQSESTWRNRWRQSWVALVWPAIRCHPDFRRKINGKQFRGNRKLFASLKRTRVNGYIGPIACSDSPVTHRSLPIAHVGKAYDIGFFCA